MTLKWVLALAIAAVAMIGITLFLWPDRWADLANEINAARQASVGELQKKRGLLISEDGLNQMSAPNLAIGVNKDDLDGFEKIILTDLNKSEDLRKNGIRFESVDIRLEEQTIQATLNASYSDANLGEMKASIAADVTVSMSGAHIFYQLFARDISLTSIKPKDSNIGSESLKKTINDTLDTIMTLGNGALDKFVNATAKLTTPLQVLPLYTGNFDRLKQPDGMKFDSRPINAAWNPRSLAALVEPGRLVVLAEVSTQAVASNWIAPKPSPLDVSSNDVRARLESYRKAFHKKFNAAFGGEFKGAGMDAIGVSWTFAIIKKDLIAATLTSALASPPIRLSGNPPVAASRQKLDMNFPAPAQRRCDAVQQSCTYKHICESREQCTETIQETFDEVIDVPRQVHETHCRLVSLGGLIKFLKRICDDVVNTVYDKVVRKAVREVTRPISSPVCEGFRQTRQLTPLLCDTASNLSKAICDSANLPSDIFCAAEQGFRSYVAHNPFATATISVEAAPKIDFTFSGLTMRSDLGDISAQISGAAKSPVKIGIAWDNHAPVACAFSWKEGFSFDASANLTAHPVSFRLDEVISDDKGALLLRYKITNEDVRIDLDKSPLDEIFVSNPQITANCPLLAAAGILYGAYDTVVNEKFKQLSGIFTGKGIKIDVSKTDFEIRIPPIQLGDKDSNISVLLPKIAKDSVIFTR